MARAVARNAEFRFGLGEHGWMCDQGCIDSLSRGWNAGVAVDYNNGRRAIGALIGRCLKLPLIAGRLAALRHVSHALMLPITTATRRQVALALGSQGEEWLNKRQTQ